MRSYEIDDIRFTWERGSLTVTTPNSPSVHYEPQIWGDRLAITTTTGTSTYSVSGPLNAKGPTVADKGRAVLDAVEALAEASAGVSR